MSLEDVAEDLNDPAVKARYAEFVKNRHYPADTYRLQDGCANCRHVFVRSEHENGNELYCTFGAPDAWKEGRRVMPQGICGEWEPNKRK